MSVRLHAATAIVPAQKMRLDAVLRAGLARAKAANPKIGGTVEEEQEARDMLMKQLLDEMESERRKGKEVDDDMDEYINRSLDVEVDMDDFINRSRKLKMEEVIRRARERLGLGG